MGLTKTQRELLERYNGRLMYDTREGRAWATAPNGMTRRVPLSTFNALTLKGYIATPNQMPGRRLYTITDAGRKAIGATNDQ